jgi:hypothetical protein
MTDRYKEAIQGAKDCVERNKDGGVYLPDLLVVIDSQQAEIEQWKAEANKYQNLWCGAHSETIKECLDRIEAFLRGVCGSVVEDNPNLDRILFGYNTEEVDAFIDNLRKEMVGEQQ